MLTSVAMLQVLQTFKAYRFCFRHVASFSDSTCVFSKNTPQTCYVHLSAASTAAASGSVGSMQCVSGPLAGSSLTGMLGYAVFQHIITSNSVCGGRKRMTAPVLATSVI